MNHKLSKHDKWIAAIISALIAGLIAGLLTLFGVDSDSAFLNPAAVNTTSISSK